MKKMTEITKEQRDNAKKEKDQFLAEFNARNTVYSDYLSKVPLSMRLLFAKLFDGKNSKADALKAKCLDCCVYDIKEVTACHIKTCPLWNFRPYQKK